MRKKDCEKEIDRLRSALETSNRSVKYLIEQHDRTILDMNCLSEIVHSLRKELKLQTWAFSIAAGRLMAHVRPENMSAEDFTETILSEARKELGTDGGVFE